MLHAIFASLYISALRFPSLRPIDFGADDILKLHSAVLAVNKNLDCVLS